MKIRPLRESDIPAAAAIVGLNYSKKWERPATAELRAMFGEAPIKPAYRVAEESGHVVGFAGYIQSWFDYGIWQIFWVNVAPSRQGRGVGRALVARLLREISNKKDCALVELSASVKNAPYYGKHFGFKTVDRFGKKGHHLMTLPLPRRKKRPPSVGGGSRPRARDGS